MKTIALSALMAVTVMFSGCSQTQVSPKCSVCDEPAPAVVVAPIVNQCPRQVSVIHYTDACNDCKTYPVTVRKNSCCSAQGCDK